MAADTSGSHCGEANKKPFSAVLCEATAKALRKTRDDRLAMLTCRNKDVLLLGSIGQGNFGQVYRARFRGAIVAVKTYEFSHVEGDEMKTFWHEVTISRRLSHPNILSFYGASVSAPEKKAYCILELCERGTFDDVLANPELSWLNARRKIMLGLCRAMCYLHAFLADVVIHHDLKPANVLVTTGFDAKVSDFGVSLVAERDPQSLGAVLVHEQHPSESDEQEEEEQQQASEGQGAQKPRPSKPLRGSPVYLAPEAHRCEAISEKIDVYAFGLVLCEALIGDGLYVIKAYSSKGKSMKESLEHGFRPGIPESIRAAMPELVALVQDCWAEEASARPCFQEINQRLESIVEEENLNLSSAASLSSRSSSTSCRLGAPEAGHDGVAPSQAAEASLRSELEGDRDATEKLRMEISARARDAPQPGSGSRSGVCKELEITTKGLSEEALIADREAKPLAEATGTSEGPRAAAGPVGLLQRMETQRFPMSAQRSPTGRSYSTFAQSITLGNGQDTTVFRELCAELQEELRQQSELYESKLAEQKARYEEQLASLTDALF